jgi:hypothetical protein
MTKAGNVDPLTWTRCGITKITGQIRKNVGSTFFNDTINDNYTFLITA